MFAVDSYGGGRLINESCVFDRSSAKVFPLTINRMKKILHLLLTHLIFITAQAQTQTHYGTGAGTQGAAHSYFGYYAGNAALNTSYENSYFGTSSGRVTTTD